MAKDGTMRGGARPGAGRKPKALAEKIAEGNPGTRTLKIVDFSDSAASLEGQDMPPPKAYLAEKQKNGHDLIATDIYRETWQWLAERGCEKLIPQQMLEQYAMTVSRWIQCEQAITEYGFLSKHPTSGMAIQSPYVAMSQSFGKMANNLWFQIFAVVRQNSSVDVNGPSPGDAVMERLLGN